MNTQLLKPAFQIGKSGVTDGIAKAIAARLKKNKIMKIRFLQSAMKGKNKEELFSLLASKTKARILKKIGFVLVLKYESH